MNIHAVHCGYIFHEAPNVCTETNNYTYQSLCVGSNKVDWGLACKLAIPLLGSSQFSNLVLVARSMLGTELACTL